MATGGVRSNGPASQLRVVAAPAALGGYLRQQNTNSGFIY
jgi:hypothetical protein